ncbi:MAG: acetylornithine/succinylornithine family transaminase [Acidimicrobiia bacterium]
MDSYLLNTYPQPKAKFVQGEGVYLFDAEGNKYLDFLSGIAVVSLGHSNPQLNKIISDQSSKLMHVSNYFENEFTQKVASKINEKINISDDVHGNVFFTNSGAEANECALKMAKLYGENKRYKFLTALGSFHGRTIATLSATGQSTKHEKFLPLPDYFDYFEINNIDSVKKLINDETVAVMLEVVQGENGVQICSNEFIEQVQNLCIEHDLLLIVDEVQTGMCRTGEWFGFQNYSIRPDIITMAKALGNGFPVGACWVNNKVSNHVKPGDHGSTFGGNALALSVVNEVFKIMEDQDLASKTASLGQYFSEMLNSTGLFSEVRSSGLLIGCDVKPELNIDANDVVQRAFDLGLVINATSASTIRIAPPLIIEKNHINEAVEILKKSMAG